MSWLTGFQLEIGGARISAAALVAAAAVILLGFAIASWLAAKVRRGSGTGPLRWRGTLAQWAGTAIRVAAVAFGLQVAGVNIGSVLAAGAVLAVGIGIAMQKVAENFVSGVILMAERTIREGDIIEFDGRVARVVRMGIRSTIALTLDEEELVIPNGLLAQSVVKNLTLTEAIYRLRVSVAVSYGADLDEVEQTLRRAAQELEWREGKHDAIVLLTGFGTSSVDFEVSVWTTDVWARRRGESDLRMAIWRALKDAGVSIPFPQLDVHFDPQGARRPADVAPPGEERQVPPRAQDGRRPPG